ncbi:preprotein translocase [Stutzerimonas stutzeri]|uniref:Sec-independent protein translocase protein TatB n=1 Tax=Stutzerimonas stutzeri TaxID=316 RepID=W8R661_STUST|nr:Sec-independent protein translocase protein TatB [Stutzerimonas stutzeri]AHL73782.1 preprotein translocase [Stutzerimonas stutzeri]MCQ4328702.1 Sec-independent protein translocase protein TatB [Stutzerimonas stutzeri]
MFDIGFTELLLIGLVALFVLGPERLPGAVRTAGLWIGRAKRSFANIKSEVEREIGADEIRRQLHNERILDLEREMKQSIMPSSPTASGSASPQSATPAPEASTLDVPAPSEAKPADTAPVPRPDRPAEP